jgi:hypothetical protein
MIYDHPSGWSGVEGEKRAAEMGFGEFVGYEVIPLLAAIDTSTEWLKISC